MRLDGYLRSVNEMNKRKIATTLLPVAVAVLFYVMAFNGDCFVTSGSGPTPIQHFHCRQFFFGKLLWEKDWCEPPLTNSSTPTHWICNYRQKWRGFGFPFKGKKDYLD